MQDLENPETRNDDVVYIGIDVSKTRLDIFILPKNVALFVDNDKAGHNKLARLCAKFKRPPLIVMEATGRYHRAVFEHLSEAEYETCVINPYQTYSFGKAMGLNTKTDRVDARMLAFFGMTMRPKPTPVLPKLLIKLKELVVSRRQFTTRQTSLSNQISECNLANVGNTPIFRGAHK